MWQIRWICQRAKKLERVQEETARDEFDELPQIFPISSLGASRFGQLVRSNEELLDKTPQNSSLCSEDEMAQEEVYYGFDEDQPAFDISRDNMLGSCLVKTRKSFNMTNFDRDEDTWELLVKLRGMGVDEALRARVGQKMAILSGSVNLNLSL